MMKFKILLLTISAMLLSSNCEKAINELEANPIVELMPLPEITSAGVEVSAKVIAVGKEEVLERGIAWLPTNTIPSYPLGPNAILADGGGLRTGENIKLQLERNLFPGNKYYIRFYTKTKSKVIYSNAKEMISRGAKSQEFQQHSSPRLNGFGINRAVYLVKGSKVYFQLQDKALLKFDTETNLWADLSAQDLFTIASDGQYFYAINTATIPYSLDSFDPETSETKTIIDNVPTSLFGRLFHFTLSNVIYVGAHSTDGLNLWEINPSKRSIRQLNALPFFDPDGGNIKAPYIYTLGDQVFALQTIKRQNLFWSYNVAQDKWEKRADYPGEGGYHFWHGTVDKRIYCGGGMYGDFNFFNVYAGPDYWSYDPQKDLWSHEGWLPMATTTILSFPANNRIYWICHDENASNPYTAITMFSFKR
jgi:hypothetical protein